MRLNETALIPQGTVGIRVGQRGKTKTVPYPTCDYCEKDALVSKTVEAPTGIKTVHRCEDHLVRGKNPTQAAILDMLIELGIL